MQTASQNAQLPEEEVERIRRRHRCRQYIWSTQLLISLKRPSNKLHIGIFSLGQRMAAPLNRNEMAERAQLGSCGRRESQFHGDIFCTALQQTATSTITFNDGERTVFIACERNGVFRLHRREDSH